jgi:hypothetical protein
MKRLFAVLAICIIRLVLLPVDSAAQGDSVEHQVKAAFLYNFAKFVDWPPTAFSRPNDAITICLAGDAFAAELEKAVQGESLNGRRLVVRRIAAPEPLRGCHILYIDPSQTRRYAELPAIGSQPVLTVGESEDFIASGGMIRFVETGHRIHFQINPEAVDRASLKVSSRLLRLAEIVRPRGKE